MAEFTSEGEEGREVKPGDIVTIASVNLVNPPTSRVPLIEWAVVMRPHIMPPDGSTVHDELMYVWEENAKLAIRCAYEEYERQNWYVLDVYPRPLPESPHPAKPK